MRTLFIATSIVVASAFLGACEEEPATVFPPVDAGTDSGVRADAGPGPSTDGGMDAGKDSGIDSGTDSGSKDAGDEADAN